MRNQSECWNHISWNELAQDSAEWRTATVNFASNTPRSAQFTDTAGRSSGRSIKKEGRKNTSMLLLISWVLRSSEPLCGAWSPASQPACLPTCYHSVYSEHHPTVSNRHPARHAALPQRAAASQKFGEKSGRPIKVFVTRYEDSLTECRQRHFNFISSLRTLMAAKS